MAIVSCPECKKEVSDKAPTCPHCGVRLARGRSRRLLWILAAVLALVVLGGGVALAMRSDYAQVDQLRAEQDTDGTRDEHVRQRFYRLYQDHPHNAMYIYLWARCVDDAAQQLELAKQGIAADPRFAWNYNMASRALARLNRVPEAYDQALKGAALDPGNLELAKKKKALKLIIDKKLMDQGAPVTAPAATFRGLFQASNRGPDHADVEAIEKARVPAYKGKMDEALRGFLVCENPYSDLCIRAYVPRDDRFKPTWQRPPSDVEKLGEHQLVDVTGAIVTNAKGETIMLADAVVVEPP